MLFTTSAALLRPRSPKRGICFGPKKRDIEGLLEGRLEGLLEGRVEGLFRAFEKAQRGINRMVAPNGLKIYPLYHLIQKGPTKDQLFWQFLRTIGCRVPAKGLAWQKETDEGSVSSLGALRGTF